MKLQTTTSREQYHNQEHRYSLRCIYRGCTFIALLILLIYSPNSIGYPLIYFLPSLLLYLFSNWHIARGLFWWLIYALFVFTDERRRSWSFCLPWRGEHLHMDWYYWGWYRNYVWGFILQTFFALSPWLSFQAPPSEVWDNVLPSKRWPVWEHLLRHPSGIDHLDYLQPNKFHY